MANPTEPKIYLIWTNIIETLSQVRRPNGYWNDIGVRQVTDEEVLPKELDKKPFPFFTVLLDDSDLSTYAMPKNDEEIATFLIDGIVYETDPKTRRKMRERAIQDVRKVLLVDTQRGDDPVTSKKVARWTLIRGVERFTSASAFMNYAGFRITVAVNYTFQWSRP